MSQLLTSLEGVMCHADDVLILRKNEAEHYEWLTAVLMRLQEAGLTLNEKCIFAQLEVLFVGHKISVAKFLPHFADSAKPLRDLVIKDNDWVCR